MVDRRKMYFYDTLKLAPGTVLANTPYQFFFNTIVQINRQGVAVLLVEQNALMALNVAHRGYVLETGQIVLEDDAKLLQQNEQVQKAYLGIE